MMRLSLEPVSLCEESQSTEYSPHHNIFGGQELDFCKCQQTERETTLVRSSMIHNGAKTKPKMSKSFSCSIR
jgi:hypothetical protein